jgi:sialidase-1
MQKLTVSRDDEVYEAFADIARTPDGALVCTYRESMAHAPWPFSRIVVRRSEDGGYTWQPRQVIIEKNTEAGEGRLNCSRITACKDGTLLLIVDFYVSDRDWLVNPVENLLFRSHDRGRTWDGPEKTGITDGIVPSIKELSNGDLLIGVTRQRSSDGRLSGLQEEQTVYRSGDGGRTWEGPSVVPAPPHLRLNEGDFVELDDGTVVCYMREDAEGFTGWKSTSDDGGRVWSEAFRSQMPACRGRPSAGRVRSGEIVVTYRFCSGVSTSLALYVETPAEAVRRGDPNPNDYATDYHQARFAFLDNDRSLHPDSGYSGWVQLPSGDLYVVNYITDDAPRAFIRGYIVSRHDWFLFPEGAVPWLHPADQPYVEMSAEWAWQQHERNRTLDWSRRVPTQK